LNFEINILANLPHKALMVFCKSQEGVFAISRSRAAEPGTEKRLGGALATFRRRPFMASSAGQSARG